MLTIKLRPEERRELEREATRRGVTLSNVVRERLGFEEPTPA